MKLYTCLFCKNEGVNLSWFRHSSSTCSALKDNDKLQQKVVKGIDPPPTTHLSNFCQWEWCHFWISLDSNERWRVFKSVACIIYCIFFGNGVNSMIEKVHFGSVTLLFFTKLLFLSLSLHNTHMHTHTH